MINLKRFLGIYLFLVFTFSCNRIPDEYLKGMEFFKSKDYDSSLFYFSKISQAEDAEWFDSSKVMKNKCFENIVDNQYWDMFALSLKTYQTELELIANGRLFFKDEMERIINIDSVEQLFKILDFHKNIPEDLRNDAINYFENKYFTGYVWNGIKGIDEQRLYFVREICKDYKGNDEGEKIQGKSNRTVNGWNKNRVIYRNICYDSAGIFTMQPRIFQDSYFKSTQYFSKKGKLEFLGKDTLLLDYGGSISRGTNKVYFVRKDSIELDT